MKINNINEIDWNCIVDSLNDELILKMKNNKITIQDLIENIKIVYKMKEEKKQFEVTNILIEMVIDCIIGYKEWIEELDNNYNYCKYYDFHCKKEELTCKGCCYEKR